MSVDVEIYMNNIIKFFRIQNYEKGEEVNLTKNQIVIICAEIHGKTKKIKEEKPKPVTIGEILNDTRYQELTIEKLIINTPFGNYSLN